MGINGFGGVSGRTDGPSGIGLVGGVRPDVVRGHGVAFGFAECFYIGEGGGVTEDELVGACGVAGELAGDAFYEECNSGFLFDFDRAGVGAFGEAFSHEGGFAGLFGIAGAPEDGVGEVFSVEPAAVLR